MQCVLSKRARKLCRCMDFAVPFSTAPGLTKTDHQVHHHKVYGPLYTIQSACAAACVSPRCVAWVTHAGAQPPRQSKTSRCISSWQQCLTQTSNVRPVCAVLQHNLLALTWQSMRCCVSLMSLLHLQHMCCFQSSTLCGCGITSTVALLHGSCSRLHTTHTSDMRYDHWCAQHVHSYACTQAHTVAVTSRRL